MGTNNNNGMIRAAQVKSFEAESLEQLDEKVNAWLIEQIKTNKRNGFSTKNIEYRSTDRYSHSATITYFIDLVVK